MSATGGHHGCCAPAAERRTAGSAATALGHITKTERIGWSYSFAAFLLAGLRRISPRFAVTSRWTAVACTTEDHPEDPGCTRTRREGHSVTLVGWADALACATREAGRLPTAAEWRSADHACLIHHLTADRVDPAGSDTGDSYVVRAGSYLRHTSCCNQYHVAARTADALDFAGGDNGFRAVRDVPRNGR
ncbi:SUMF1/EgtB/PvdO family nonheme iron enzyme [Kineococcus sp. SYSU DK001]|uniref:SUMF1/EgtB/PvdO family nonheme iron enzyme n=1 Tax=Kineococcus sp. SYSU DK001 TaxID=3383122 RepID=UPI003D7EA5DA